MTDRELLELAAKAADADVFMKCGPNNEAISNWNPLNDDGDALRLAVKLGMRISVVRCHPAHGNPRIEVVCWSVSLAQHCINADDDYEAATRRAIVRAAAEIGKSIK